jgi:hypothetical protein
MARPNGHRRQFPAVPSAEESVGRRPVTPQILRASLESDDALVEFHDRDLLAAARAVSQGPVSTAFERANGGTCGALRAFVTYNVRFDIDDRHHIRDMTVQYPAHRFIEDASLEPVRAEK